MHWQFSFFDQLSISGAASTILYLGYSFVLAFILFIFTGTIGFLSTFWFVSKIYSVNDDVKQAMLEAVSPETKTKFPGPKAFEAPDCLPPPYEVALQQSLYTEEPRNYVCQGTDKGYVL